MLQFYPLYIHRCSNLGSGPWQASRMARWNSHYTATVHREVTVLRSLLSLINRQNKEYPTIQTTMYLCGSHSSLLSLMGIWTKDSHPQAEHVQEAEEEWCVVERKEEGLLNTIEEAGEEEADIKVGICLENKAKIALRARESTMTKKIWAKEGKRTKTKKEDLLKEEPSIIIHTCLQRRQTKEKECITILQHWKTWLKWTPFIRRYLRNMTKQLTKIWRRGTKNSKKEDSLRD